MTLLLLAGPRGLLNFISWAMLAVLTGLSSELIWTSDNSAGSFVSNFFLTAIENALCIELGRLLADELYSILDLMLDFGGHV